MVLPALISQISLMNFIKYINFSNYNIFETREICAGSPLKKLLEI